MGSWGTAISSNDTYSDIYSEFFDLYNNGLDVSEISKKLISDNKEILNDPDECNNLWFALAKAQWECKQLDKNVFDQVKKIVETGADIDIWRELNANEKDIKKRKFILDKFLLDLQKERLNPRARKKKRIRQPVFEKGDCLTFKLQSGNYGGAVVLEAIYDSEYGYNLIATTRYNQSNKPTKEDFENAEILILNHPNWDYKPNINWYIPIRHKHIAHLIEKVDSINIKRNYDVESSMIGFMADFDIWIIQIADNQFEFETSEPQPSLKQTLQEFIKESKYL